MLRTLDVVLGVDPDRFAVPEEPDGTWLGGAVGADGGEPDDLIVGEVLGDAGAEVG